MSINVYQPNTSNWNHTLSVDHLLLTGKLWNNVSSNGVAIIKLFGLQTPLHLKNYWESQAAFVYVGCIYQYSLLKIKTEIFKILICVKATIVDVNINVYEK